MVAIGDEWVDMDTHKQLLWLLTVGGMQCEVVSLLGTPVTLAGWGGKLAVVYQVAPCGFHSDFLLVHVTLSHRAKLEWIWSVVYITIVHCSVYV